MKNYGLSEITLSYKQKLILDILKDEFHGSAFGPQMLDESEDAKLRELSINEITYAFGMLVNCALINKKKKSYKGRILNEYSLSEYVLNDAVIIK